MTTTTTKVPATPLPTHPSARAAYLHSTQLALLRETYHGSLARLAHLAALPRSTRTGTTSRRRRRSPSPTPSHSSSLSSSSAQSDDNSPPPPPSSSSSSTHTPTTTSATKLDAAHDYALTYDLAPAGSADSYYHGSQPLPPPRAVRRVLKSLSSSSSSSSRRRSSSHATGLKNKKRRKLYFDPKGVESTVLDACTSAVWHAEGGARKGPAAADEAAAAWEDEVVERFSAACDEKVARAMLRSKGVVSVGPAAPGLAQQKNVEKGEGGESVSASGGTTPGAAEGKEAEGQREKGSDAKGPAAANNNDAGKSNILSAMSRTPAGATYLPWRGSLFGDRPL